MGPQIFTEHLLFAGEASALSRHEYNQLNYNYVLWYMGSENIAAGRGSIWVGSMNEESGKRGKGREREELCKGPGAGKGWESCTIPTMGGEV